MGDATTISWTDATWNVTRGCRRVSPGCENCYAERQANRFKGPGGAYEGLIKLVGGKPRWSGETKFATEHLADPLRWKSPRRVFVDSMSDLFYEGFTNEQIAAVFGVMAACPHHTFQVLTKRAKRMREWFEWMEEQREVDGDPWVTCLREALCWLPEHTERLANCRLNVGGFITPGPWPLPNVWLGVSVENQDAHDERAELMLECPAATYFFSVEPMLGPVDARQSLRRMLRTHDGRLLRNDHPDTPSTGGTWRRHVDWVIAGCESGPGARPCSVEWLRSLRDQCASSGAAFFLKQAVQPYRDTSMPLPVTSGVGSKLKGSGVIELPYLDGVQHAAFPIARQGDV